MVGFIPRNITQNEVNDFIESCHRRQIDENDFTINNLSLDDVIKQPGMPAKIILKNSSASKEYSLSDFPGVCAYDVENGFFG